MASVPVTPIPFAANDNDPWSQPPPGARLERWARVAIEGALERTAA